MEPKNNDTLGGLEAELIDALMAKAQADRKESEARNAAAAATNAVNALQKRIDAKIAQMKSESAMRGTDWDDRRRDAAVAVSAE